MTDPLERKKRVRSAHRGAATRVIGQVQENLTAEHGPNMAKLRQQRNTLIRKSELLSTLDAELMDAVELDELENEVEQIDAIKEKIECAILEIDSVLNPEEHDASSRGSDGTTSPPLERPRSSLSESSGSSVTESVPTSEVTPTVPATTDTVATPGVTPAIGAVSTITHSSGLIPQIKLPKLSLKKFGGDPTQWMTFWDSFDSSIHSNPTLSDIDKFNYLVLFLESTAAESIAGLTPTSSNYKEAVDTLKGRFGDPQIIISRHMDALLSLSVVASHHDHKSLRRLYDMVEAHVRGLKSLKVPVDSYGSLLTSLLMSRLPSEIRIIITRELSGGSWDIERMMRIVHREVDARERSAASTNPPIKRPHQRGLPTAAALLTKSRPSGPSCVYCGRNHPSSFCATLTNVDERKEVLRKAGRCYLCLRKHHLSRNCRSSNNCSRCRGRHHTSLCQHSATNTAPPQSLDVPPVSESTAPPQLQDTPPVLESTPSRSSRTTNTMCIDSRTPVLLQTAKLRLCNLQDEHSSTVTIARAILDSGSQKSYVSSRVKETLQLPVKCTEALCIRTFGSSEERIEECEIVEVGLHTDDGQILKLSAVVVPFICDPLTSQPINHSERHYYHLSGLKLADSANLDDTLAIDALIGSDFYWKLVTGRIMRGSSGPTALHTRVGWVLSGPVQHQSISVNLTTVSSAHALKIETYPAEQGLDDHLKRFWELESLGVMENEPLLYEKFTQQISFNGERYSVALPWREDHPPLPDHFELCYRRLHGLLNRLKQDPSLLKDYHTVISEQIAKGIVEVVDDPSMGSDRIHYLPHHAVVRQDKMTTKLRVVYDASARTTGPSLNDCLYIGPNFGQSIFAILLRFRLHKIALAGDIEKAFLMVAVNERDRDALRFLWSSNPEAEEPKIITLRFARVAFGVSSSPFLLNATINHHMELYRDCDPSFVDKFISSIYVDDVSLGSADVESTYDLYLKSKTRLAEAGFRLRKFVTNSSNLYHRIQLNEGLPGDHNLSANMKEDDQSYAKDTLGRISKDREGHKILGIRWDYNRDVFSFDVGEIYRLLLEVEPTKRNVVSMSAKFYDPLGIVSPITILFKMFFQQLCKAKIDWDEPITGDLAETWKKLCSAVKSSEVLVVPRCYLDGVEDQVRLTSLVGFCDASTKAYAAVVYMRLETESQVHVRFICAKTRVAPLQAITVPRLELLSALLLSRLISSVQSALKSEISLGELMCYTDSKVALFWIRGHSQQWKQFVENRVVAIRSLVPARLWRHCPGRLNPADIPSRGATADDLVHNDLWLNGPGYLRTQDLIDDADLPSSVPEECRSEMRSQGLGHTLAIAQIDQPGIGKLIDCSRYSSLHRLLKVTALVLRFVHLLRSNVQGSRGQPPGNPRTELEGVNQARMLWIRESQSRLPENKRFRQWRHQFGLFLDSLQIWRCGGRMGNSDLPPSSQQPVLLDKTHHLTKLIVMEAHNRVKHNGVKETLTELRSAYWVMQGRQFVRQLIYRCVICRRVDGRPYRGISPPPLPEYRVSHVRPFSHTGVDFAGPMYVKDPTTSDRTKTWLCLFTCCSTRAVHLDLVPDLSAATFIRSFKRFTARRGIPSLMLSDNGKTFKAASRLIKRVLEDTEVIQNFMRHQVEWRFNLEKAPWQGGIFERMIKSTKRCLRKTIGQASLTYDELLTIVIEVEAVLNSRPLSYISADDLDEPLTPSHLMLGFRVLSMPDPPAHEDLERNESLAEPTRRMRHLLKVSERFWERWKNEYLLEMREFHRIRKPDRGNREIVKEGEVVAVFDEMHPRSFWRLGRIESIIHSSDGGVRGAQVRVKTKSGSSTILRRPIQHLYPLGVHSEAGPAATDEPDKSSSPLRTSRESPESSDPPNSWSQVARTHRQAAVQARDRILGHSLID